MIQRPSLDSLLRNIREGGTVGGGGGGGSVFAMRVEARSDGPNQPMTIISSDGSGVPPAGVDAEGYPLTYQTEFFTGALSAPADEALSGLAQLCGLHSLFAGFAQRRRGKRARKAQPPHHCCGERKRRTS